MRSDWLGVITENLSGWPRRAKSRSIPGNASAARFRCDACRVRCRLGRPHGPTTSRFVKMVYGAGGLARGGGGIETGTGRSESSMGWTGVDGREICMITAANYTEEALARLSRREWPGEGTPWGSADPAGKNVGSSFILSFLSRRDDERVGNFLRPGRSASARRTATSWLDVNNIYVKGSVNSWF